MGFPSEKEKITAAHILGHKKGKPGGSYSSLASQSTQTGVRAYTLQTATLARKLDPKSANTRIINSLSPGKFQTVGSSRLHTPKQSPNHGRSQKGSYRKPPRANSSPQTRTSTTLNSSPQTLNLDNFKPSANVRKERGLLLPATLHCDLLLCWLVNSTLLGLGLILI